MFILPWVAKEQHWFLAVARMPAEASRARRRHAWVTTPRFVADAGGTTRVGALPAENRLPGRASHRCCACNWPLPRLALGTAMPTLLIAAPEVNADLGAAVTAPGMLRFTFVPTRLLW